MNCPVVSTMLAAWAQQVAGRIGASHVVRFVTQAADDYAQHFEDPRDTAVAKRAWWATDWALRQLLPVVAVHTDSLAVWGPLQDTMRIRDLGTLQAVLPTLQTVTAAIEAEARETIDEASCSTFPGTPMATGLQQLATVPGPLEAAVPLVRGAVLACGEALTVLPEATPELISTGRNAVALAAGAVEWLLRRQAVQNAEREAWEYVRSGHLMAAAMKRATQRAVLKQQRLVVQRLGWLLSGLLAKGVGRYDEVSTAESE